MALVANPMSGVRVPDNNEQDDIGTILARMTADEAPLLWPVYANTGERDTKVTVANGAKVGQKCSTLAPPRDWKITAINGSQITWAPLLAVVDDVIPTALAGTNWDGVSPLDRRQFNVSGTVQNNVGNTPFQFMKGGVPVPFANGVLDVHMVLGDGGADTITLAPTLTTLSQCIGLAKLIGGGFPASGGKLRASIIVVGW